MFRLLALGILLVVVIAITGSGWWIIPVLVVAAIIESNSRTITINLRIDD